MTVHYRRGTVSRADQLGAIGVSVLAGLGAAAAAFYLTRLYLSRERLGPAGEWRGGGVDSMSPTEPPYLSGPGGTTDEGG